MSWAMNNPVDRQALLFDLCMALRKVLGGALRDLGKRGALLLCQELVPVVQQLPPPLLPSILFHPSTLSAASRSR